VFSMMYELLAYVLFRRVFCFAVLQFNALNVAAFLNTSQHSLEVTEENHEDAVRNVYCFAVRSQLEMYCFGVRSQLEMFSLAGYQRLTVRW